MTSPFLLSVAWLLEERVCSEGRDLVFFNVPLLRQQVNRIYFNTGFEYLNFQGGSTVINAGVRAGADPGFFLGGGALVSCPASTPINHIVFFLQNISCIKKPQVISGRRAGAHPLHPPPRSAPANTRYTLLWIIELMLSCETIKLM